MRTDRSTREQPTTKCFAISSLQRMERDYQAALVDLEKEQWSFSILSDVCLPVLVLIVMVVWGYQLNAIIVNNDEGDNHLMLLVYGIGLIVISGTSCVYIVIRMAVIRPEKTTRYLQREIIPIYTEQKRSQPYYYQTIPEIHKNGKKLSDIFIV